MKLRVFNYKDEWPFYYKDYTVKQINEKWALAVDRYEECSDPSKNDTHPTPVWVMDSSMKFGRDFVEVPEEVAVAYVMWRLQRET